MRSSAFLVSSSLNNQIPAGTHRYFQDIVFLEETRYLGAGDLFFRDCDFLYASVGNQLSLHAGNPLLFGCRLYHSEFDQIDHDNSVQSTIINSIAKYAGEHGKDATGNNQNDTSHGSAKTIRVNNQYGYASDSPIYDVGAESWVLGCNINAVDYQNTDGSTTQIAIGHGATDKMYIQDTKISGSYAFEYGSQTADIRIRLRDMDINSLTKINSNVNLKEFDYVDPNLPIDSSVLDFVPGSAIALSTNSLSTDYTGNIMEIRRSSDNATLNFKGDASGAISLSSPDENDTTTLGAWIGSNSGYVQTWYDQEGSNNAVQTDPTKQPLIVNAGSLIVEGTKAAVLFDGNNDEMQFTAITSDSLTIVSIVNETTSGSKIHLGHFGGSANFFTHKNTATNHRVRIDNNVADFTSPIVTGQQLLTFAKDNVNAVLYQDNSLLNTRTELGASTATFDLLGRWTDGATHDLDGTTQTLIIYTTDERSNISKINSELNDYFSIY